MKRLLTSDEIWAMNPTVFVLQEAKTPEGVTRPEKCDAYLLDTGEKVLFANPLPLRDGARLLLERGISPDAMVATSWHWAPRVIAMYGRVGVCAEIGKER